MPISNEFHNQEQSLGVTSKDVFHVFLISNPVNAVTCRMFVEAMSIPLNMVICVSIRDADTTLVPSERIIQKTYTLDRVIQKLFDMSSAGIRLRRNIEAKCEKFILYTSWLFADAEALLGSSRCLGHYYLEEGQLSYYNAGTFSVNSGTTFRFRQQQKALGSVDFHYRDDCYGYIGILQIGRAHV